MNDYIVFNAGFPHEKTTIYAESALDAAKKYFWDHQFKDPIVVKWGFWDSKIVFLKDLQVVIPNIDESKLKDKPKPKEEPNEEMPKTKRTFWQRLWEEYFYRFFTQRRHF